MNDTLNSREYRGVPGGKIGVYYVLCTPHCKTTIGHREGAWGMTVGDFLRGLVRGNPSQYFLEINGQVVDGQSPLVHNDVLSISPCYNSPEYQDYLDSVRVGSRTWRTKNWLKNILHTIWSMLYLLGALLIVGTIGIASILVFRWLLLSYLS